MNEIASSFVSLTPRNDVGNSLLARNDGISAMMDEFRIYCDEIPQSSWGMTKKVKSGDDKEHARRDFYRDCPVKPDNDTRLMRSPSQAGG